VKKCEYCYPKDENVKEQIGHFHTHPFEVMIGHTMHIAYNVIPQLDSYQTWCGREFSMRKLETHPKIGVSSVEPVSIIIDSSNAPKSILGFYDFMRAIQYLRPKEIKEEEPFLYTRNSPQRKSKEETK
jgi:hypothetical protein